MELQGGGEAGREMTAAELRPRNGRPVATVHRSKNIHPARSGGEKDRAVVSLGGILFIFIIV